MSINIGIVDAYISDHIAELMREVENDRLADRATGGRQPARVRVALWLHAAANRLEGQPAPRHVNATA